MTPFLHNIFFHIYSLCIHHGMTMNFLSIRGDRSWDSCWAYVGPFRGYVGAKKFAQQITQFLARKSWGWRRTCLAYVGACWGFVGLFGLSWPIWGCQLGPCWSYVGPALGDLGFYWGQKWTSTKHRGSSWANMGCSSECSRYSPDEHASLAMLRLCGVNVGNPPYHTKTTP